MRFVRSAVFVVTGLLATSCGQAGSVDAGGTAEVDLTNSSTLPADLLSEDAGTENPTRFGEFPPDPSDQWLIAVDYVGTSFVDLSSGTSLDAEATAVQFLGRTQISIATGGCGIGGSFDFVDGRVTNLLLEGPEELCTPSEGATYEAARSLIEADPEIRVDENRLLLLSDRYRLEMRAAGPGIEPIVEDYERFVAIETTVAGIDPTRIELTSPAFFVVRVTVPTCDLHGSTTTEGDQQTFQIKPLPGYDPCEYSPPTDKATQAFFADGGQATRAGNVLEVAGSQGTIRFRLATAEDPPLAREEALPPPLVIPSQPDRSLPAELGRPSEPWFTARAGSTGSNGIDVPVPDEWEARDPSIPSVAVAGRGYIQVTTTAEPWDPDNHSDMLQVVEGPSPVTVKLYQEQDGVIIESGATATVDQYHYGSTDPNTWNRLVVWVFERNGTTTIAEVAYPEFPEDSSFSNPADSRDLSLTGLDPIDLLHDIRFFE